jgi:hypothetical protein
MNHSTHCRCGHAAEAHDHFRPGNECDACRCRRFDGVSRRDVSPSTGLATLLLAAFAPSLTAHRPRT